MNEQPHDQQPTRVCSRARCGGRAAACCGNGCGRRSPRLRPRSDFSSHSPGPGFGCCCRRSRAPSACRFRLLSIAAAVRWRCCGCRASTTGLRRLDRSSGEMHRPATAIADDIAANGNDPVAQALWRAHVERALLSARKIKAGWPMPRLSLRDPMALRALVPFWWWRRSSRPAANGSSGSPPPSTGTAW